MVRDTSRAGIAALKVTGCVSNCCQVCLKGGPAGLLEPQRRQRIDAGRALRGDHARDRGDGE